MYRDKYFEMVRTFATSPWVCFEFLREKIPQRSCETSIGRLAHPIVVHQYSVDT